MGQDGTMNSCGNEISRFKHTKRLFVFSVKSCLTLLQPHEL